MMETLTEEKNKNSAGGGGGKSDVRKDKIKAKNHKLNEERVRKMQEEEAAKLAKDKKKGDKKPAAAQDYNEADDIHPSRRGWVPHK
jgi:nucleolar protein 6